VAGLSRREFVAVAGALGAALAGLPRLVSEGRWVDIAAAAEQDITRDAINGLIAFIVPGNDEYSVAQGVFTDGPGGIATGALPPIIETLDRSVPPPLVGSATAAQVLNGYARAVNANASGGGFVSPFARLSFREKGEVFRRFESDPALKGSYLHNRAGLLPSTPSFIAFGTPTGWQISGYAGPTDGWDELKGYWAGRREATRRRGRA
jgi:hypothetical protein